jgi:bacterioferritin
MKNLQASKPGKTAPLQTKDEVARQENEGGPPNQASPDRVISREATGNVKQIRQNARQYIENGAVTAAYGLDPKVVCENLNAALATELVCVLRYRRHHFMASGIHSEAVASEFLTHSQEELSHADMLAARIIQLGGEPDFNPDGLHLRSHAEYIEGTTLKSMLQEDLVAERIAIQSYTETIKFLGDKDPTTRRILEEILAKEEEHADDLASLLQGPAN